MRNNKDIEKAPHNRQVTKRLSTRKLDIGIITMYASQTIECAGTARTEYRYEPEVVEDEAEAVEVPLTCGQCDYFRIWGGCALLGYKRKASSLACPEIRVTCPF